MTVSFSLILLLSSVSLLPSPPGAAQVSDDAAHAQPFTLHRWGAVTLFHGLPSEQVRAIAEDADGLMWFGTDAGLARYDGRRTQAVTDELLAGQRVFALAVDARGALWVGAEGGAFLRDPETRLFQSITETKGKRVSAVHAPSKDRALLATTDGFVFDCRRDEDGALQVRALVEGLTVATGKSQPLELTSVALRGDAVVVGTRGRGLLSISPDGTVRDAFARAARPSFVEAIEVDADGVLVFGAQASAGDSGLYKAEGARPAARPAKLTVAATGDVSAIALAPGGEVYAGTDGRGVFRLTSDGRVRERFTFEETAGGLRSDRVHTIFIDREGVVWLGTARGVCRYDPHGVSVESLAADSDSNFVRSLYRTSRGRLLVGTNRGLFVRDEAAASWRAVEEVRGKTVYAMAEDQKGRLLVGTAGGLFVGLQTDARPRRVAVKLAPEEKALDDEEVEREAERRSPEPALSGSVRAIAPFGDAVYVATFGRGLERFDGPARRTLIWPRGDGDARAREVVSLFADETSGRLWVGTANAGVFYFDGREVRSEPALSELTAGTVWSIGGAGGTLWFATSQGLYALRPGQPLAAVAPGVDARSVVAVAPSKRGMPRAWCATAGSGVLRVALDELFGPITSRLDTEQGLPTQNAFAVLTMSAGREEAETTSAGRGQRATAASNVDESDAARTERERETEASRASPASNDASAHTVVLIGTTRGLARYEPGRRPPVLRLTRVTASRTYQPEELRGGPLRLEYPQNSLVVDVAANASRTFPEQFQYAFTLEDGDGRALRRRFTHDSQFQAEELEAGRYRVVARAYTLDLTPSEPISFEFTVARAPFPWTTLALSVLLALALVALLWTYVQHVKIVRSGEELREANSQLAAARLQLANEAETERRRIARDLHDQTLADLRRLLLMADEIERDSARAHAEGALAQRIATATVASATLDPAVLRAEIEAISQEVRRICEDLSPSVLENVGFTAALEWALATSRAHMPPERQFDYEFACEEDLEERLHFPPNVQMQIYRIVQEAVSNVCRHAEAARVRMTAKLDETGNFVFTLEDDGRGFDAAHKKTRAGRGLAGIRARAGLIDAEVSWRSQEGGGGTVFTLRKSKATARA